MFHFRSMCIKGLVIVIESTVQIAHKLLQMDQKYLLCYKLSQDHLELLFNAIRRTSEYLFLWNDTSYFLSLIKFTLFSGLVKF